MFCKVSLFGRWGFASVATSVVAAALVAATPARASGELWDFIPEEQKNWEEQQVELPPMPAEANLREFFVDARAANHFYLDEPSISVGRDGVVRYTLVVVTSGGARNVSYEGLRCFTGEHRFYAFANRSGTWNKARSATWKPAHEDGVNRPQAVLAKDFFCPLGVIVSNADQAREVLRRGGHPDARSTKAY